jgi:hypothetical protein
MSELSNAVVWSILAVRKPLPSGLKGTKPMPSSSRVGSTSTSATCLMSSGRLDRPRLWPSASNANPSVRLSTFRTTRG